ncbi:unnamed protein product [Ceratitis capitata]|uniref:(Mediterranean fruit fly) hypothetical protein n=1 Tax=Ceratitis capitata TaxID=7213 RepID=A0A811UXH1_CERCA|nr:unnamed protein product [Ceratitis capitata]
MRHPAVPELRVVVAMASASASASPSVLPDVFLTQLYFHHLISYSLSVCFVVALTLLCVVERLQFPPRNELWLTQCDRGVFPQLLRRKISSSLHFFYGFPLHLSFVFVNFYRKK